MIFSIPKWPENLKTCKRAKLDTGTFCNYKCYFCYYKNSLNQKTPYNTILQRIEKLENLGCRDFDLSGGEPTLHENFFDILKLLQSKKYKISCVTNGSMFANIDFIKRAKDLGLSEVLFSLHSGNASIYNFLTGSKGFNRIIKAIENTNSLDIKVRLNSTILKENYDLNNFKDTIKNFNISQINFLPFNNFEQTKLNQNIDFSQIMKFIGNTKIETNIRYIPFCFLPESYHKNIKNYYQHIFDLSDWNIAWYNYIPDTYENINNSILQNRSLYYFKTKKCFTCKYNLICDGFKKS